jgi:hypothetical protein
MGREQTLGKVVVVNAGFPQRAIATALWCINYMIEPLPTNQGKIYIGGSDMVVGTGVGVRAYLPIPHANVVSAYSPGRGEHGQMSYNLADLYIDSEFNDEGVYIAYNA